MKASRVWKDGVMGRTKTLWLLPLLCALSWTPLAAGTIDVPDDYPTIQAAIGDALDGDVIVVAPGVYVENIDFLGKAITVRSSDGAAVTTIDGSDQTLGVVFGSVVNFLDGEGNDSILEGFTITGGVGTSPGAIPQGGGIICTFSAPTIRNNIITGNSVPGGGGGIYLLAAQNAVISGNIIADNSASIGCGIVLFDCSGTVVTANTLSNNGPQGLAAFSNLGSIGTVLTNSILWGDEGPEIEDSTGTLAVTFCVVEGGWPGTGNIDEDPEFIDPDGDYHVGAGSPCIDAGDAGAPGLPVTDIDGEDRVLCGTVDIGADEVASCAANFIRGDFDGSGALNGLVDALGMLAFAFQGGPAPPCLEAADVDNSGAFNGLLDALFLLNGLFADGPFPAPPFPACGPDPDPAGSLGCGPNACP